MIAPQTYSSYPTFGTSATKCQPVQVKYETGYIPGDVLPAEHLNWFLAGATCNITLASAGIVNLQQEMQTILCCAGQAPSSCLTCVDQVYNAMMYQINASAAQRAPTAHASSATTYGVGTADSYGHLKISDTYTEVLSACSGVAASQKALACVYAAAGAKAGVGNTAGCPLGTASAGVAVTAARSDHVHPVTGLATTCVDSTNWPGIGVAGGYSTFIRTTECGFIPYCIDTTNGSGYLGVEGWPFKEVHAKNFYGTLHGNAASSSTIYVEPYSADYNFNIVFTNSNAGGNQVLFASTGCPLIFNPFTGFLTAAGFIGSLHGNADTASYAYQATGPIPFDAAEEARPLGTCVRAVVTKGTTDGIGYRSRMAIGLMYCGTWAHGLISVGCTDDGTGWDDFLFPVGHGGTVVTSTTIGSQSVACATEANCACYARCLHFEQLTNNTACPVYYYYAGGKTYLCATGPAMIWITNPYGVSSSSPSIYKAGVSKISESEGDPGWSYIKF